MDSVADVFAKFGGAQNFATLLGVTPQAATNMKSRGSIPSRHWERLVEEAKTRGIEGITYEGLAAIKPAQATSGEAA